MGGGGGAVSQSVLGDSGVYDCPEVGSYIPPLQETALVGVYDLFDTHLESQREGFSEKFVIRVEQGDVLLHPHTLLALLLDILEYREVS